MQTVEMGLRLFVQILQSIGSGSKGVGSMWHIHLVTQTLHLIRWGKARGGPGSAAYSLMGERAVPILGAGNI